ncbi:MAG: phospholipase D-like domain-containing protein [Pseudomonadota bacterium]
MAAEITLQNCEILITAEEAFRAFEKAVLAAQSDIVAGFRLFDFDTKLRSTAARQIGETWFDLILHKADSGVRFDLTVSDFDPIVRSQLHGHAWRTVRFGEALKQAARHPENITVQADMHGARVGAVSSLALWPKARGLLEETIGTFEQLKEDAQTLFLKEHPGLAALLRDDGHGAPKPRLWPPEKLVPATHHHKLAVIDGRKVYIGGLDLNDRRYDTPAHDQSSAQTWHDIQLLIDDAALATQARTHLDVFRQHGAAAAKSGSLQKPFLATRSVGDPAALMSMAPLPVEQGLRQAILDNIAQSRDLIYLETQYFRDREVADALVQAAQKWAGLSLVMILPAAPEDVAFEGADGSDARFGEYLQAECVSQVADAFGPRAFFGAPVKKERALTEGRATLHQAPLIYVHAKVSIFDDRAAIVSSANLNGRSLSWDTEAGVELTSIPLVKKFKARCISHWLEGGDPSPFMTGPDAIKAWCRLGALNAATAPQDRTGFLVPYDKEPGRRFGQNLPGIPGEMV